VSIEFAPKEREGRSLTILIPLLLLHLGLISMQVEDPSGVLLFKRWVMLASSPFFNASSAISRGTTSAWRNYLWLHKARQENEQLQDTVRLLSLRDSALSQIKDENARLHRLLAINQSLDVQSTGAHIVGRAPSFLSNVMIIDRGSEDGVRLDCAVISADGVVGRTVLVSRHDSQVQLISNSDSSIGVMLESTRSPGILKGTGTGVLELHYIGNAERVEPGDKILSSGLDGIYPKGVMVGRVLESRKGKSVFRVIQVEPAADLIHLEEVLVVLGVPKPSTPIPGDPLVRER
jgi:rod shape-determining protein MreC